MLDEAFIEELRGWLTVNSGESVKVEKPRKKTQAIQCITAVIPFLISSSNAVIVKHWAFVFSMHYYKYSCSGLFLCSPARNLQEILRLFFDSTVPLTS